MASLDLNSEHLIQSLYSPPYGEVHVISGRKENKMPNVAECDRQTGRKHGRDNIWNKFWRISKNYSEDKKATSSQARILTKGKLKSVNEHNEVLEQWAGFGISD